MVCVIKTIKIHNFGKIENLEIDCSGNRNVYILGQNGSGKTTILQAISLALTGKVAKGITNDAYIGPKDKDFLIILELDDGTKIGRTCKGAKLKLPNGSIFKKVKDVYDHLSFDPALLYNLSYVRQGEIADIFLSGNGKAVVDKLVSLIIDSKRISEGNTDLTRLAKQLESDYDSIDNDIKHNKDLMNSVNYEGLIEDYNKYKDELDKLTSIMQYSSYDLNMFLAKRDKLDSVKALIKSYKEKYDELKGKVDTLAKPSITLQELANKRTLSNSWHRDELNLQSYKDEILLFEESKKYSSTIDEYISIRLPRTSYSQEELNDIKKTKDEVLHYLSTEDICADAESLMKKYHSQEEVDADTIIETKKKINWYVKLLSPYEQVVRYVRSTNLPAYQAIDNRIAELNKHIDTIMNSYNGVDIPIEEITDEQFNSLQHEWNAYNSVMSMYQTTKSELGKLITEYKQLDSEVSQYPSREDIIKLKDSQNTINHLNSMIDMCEKHFKLYNDAKSNIEELEFNKNDITNKLNRIVHWKGIFSEVPNRLRQVLFNPVVAVLNKEFYDLFSFSGLGEIKIDWSKVMITVGDKRFEQLSGAQMVAVGLSLRLALLKVMGECVPIMLVDEPTTFLDDDRKNDIAKLLSHMGSVSQCFVSTHDDNIIGSNSVIINLNK